VLERRAAIRKARYIGYSGDEKRGEVCRRVRYLRYAADVDQHRRPAGDRSDARRGRAPRHGRDRQAPDRERRVERRPQTHNSYAHPYWDACKRLEYDFLKGDLRQSIQTALRFTLSQPGVATAIVGTKNPKRWSENAALVGTTPARRNRIDPQRWKQIAGKRLGRAGLEPDFRF